MARGGARQGSGRKPGRQDQVVLRMPNRRPPVAIPSAPVAETDVDGLLVAPEDLPLGAQACWRRCAARAIAERTLTLSTAAGFRQLCQQWDYLAQIEARLQTLGPATTEADPYLKTYIKLAQRLDASLARFKLTAFGKPAVSDKPKATANPWAQVATK